MKTIKIIDLLNKIANDEEAPKKIKFDTDIYYLSDNNYYVRKCGDFTQRLDIEYNLFNCLNDEVEIIKEDKGIEKLDVALLGQCDNWLQKRDVNIKSEFELNPYIIDNIRENTLYFQRKINELIDVVNKLNKK